MDGREGKDDSWSLKGIGALAVGIQMAINYYSQKN